MVTKQTARNDSDRIWKYPKLVFRIRKKFLPVGTRVVTSGSCCSVNKYGQHGTGYGCNSKLVPSRKNCFRIHNTSAYIMFFVTVHLLCSSEMTRLMMRGRTSTRPPSTLTASTPAVPGSLPPVGLYSVGSRWFLFRCFFDTVIRGGTSRIIFPRAW